MSANFVKRYCAIGWDWHFETDGYSSPVSNVVKEYIESIEADNAELRTQLADVTESMGRVEERCAKLRELVRHLYECMCNIDMDGNHECFSCEYENTDGLCDYERLMRELGVEVE